MCVCVCVCASGRCERLPPPAETSEGMWHGRQNSPQRSLLLSRRAPALLTGPERRGGVFWGGGERGRKGRAKKQNTRRSTPGGSSILSQQSPCAASRKCSVADDFGIEHPLEVDEAELVLELVEEEEVGRDRAAGGLRRPAAELGHVRVLETRVHREPSGRVERERALDEVDCRRVRAAENLAHRDAPLAARVCAEVLARTREPHARKVRRRRRAEHLEDEQ